MSLKEKGPLGAGKTAIGATASGALFGQGRKGRYCSTKSQGGPSVGSAWGQAERHLETETQVWEAARDTPGWKPQH